MPIIPIIGIRGKARTGKDTVAKFIVALRGGYIQAFAQPIKDMLVSLGVDMDDPYWESHKEEKIPALGMSPRRLMQTLGTEWGRQTVNEDIWITIMANKFLANGPGLIIPDVRFDNEARWVRNNNGVIINVYRQKANKVEVHESECGDFQMHSRDLHIFNNGSLEDLYAEVKGLIYGKQTRDDVLQSGAQSFRA